MNKITRLIVASFVVILAAFSLMLYFTNPALFMAFYGLLGVVVAAIYTLLVWGLSWCVIFPKLMAREEVRKYGRS